MLIEDRTKFTTAEWLGIINAIYDAQTLNGLADVFAMEIGHTAAIRQIIPPIGARERNQSGRFYSYNMPDEFLDYLKSSYSKDLGIILQHVLKLGRAVWLSDLLKCPHFIESGQDKVIRRFLDLVVDGICVPSFNPTFRGYNFLSFGKPKDHFGESFIWQVQSLCQHIHIQYATLKNLLQEKVDLTNRELDVIELMAMGKSNVEIGLILGISNHTVDGYIRQIYLKLDVRDRVSATLRAISLDLIN